MTMSARAMMEARILSGPEDCSGVPYESFGKLLLRAFQSQKDNIAVLDRDSGASYTYGYLINLAQNLAGNLQVLVNKDDVVALVAENSHRFCVALLAALFLGSPVHLLNPAYTEYELYHLLNISKAKLIFCTKRSIENVRSLASSSNFVKVIILLDDDTIDGDLSFSHLTKKSLPFRLEEDFDIADRTAIICNSSGTTGLPKCAVLTHANLRLFLVHIRHPNYIHLESNETIPLFLPLFHVYGLSTLTYAFVSGCKVLMMDHFDGTALLQSVQDYKVQKLFVVPAIINFLGATPLLQEFDLSSVTDVYTGGSPLLAQDAQTLIGRLKLKNLHMTYGLTETVGCCVHTSSYFRCSNGKPLTGYKFMVVDVTSGSPLGANETGEVCVGGNLMKGYIGGGEDIRDEGFLHTGDLGYYDEDGFVYITGRIKDLIKYKSYQVPPTQLENILLHHPSIKEVAVVGKPDRKVGEMAVAFVVKKEGAVVTEQEICAYLARFVCEEKRLHGGVKFVEILPRNSTGKTMRTRLREMLL